MLYFCTSSVSLELLRRFARALARVAFLRNMALLSINMKAIWRANFLKSCEQADQCNNSGETEEVSDFKGDMRIPKQSSFHMNNYSYKFSGTDEALFIVI